ncbi:MAG: hypothetical protein QXL16_02780, partial [Candidatus Micrarchaeaceae archaeon]
GLLEYLSAALGNKEAKKGVEEHKANIGNIFPYGPRMDVAGDRATEYILFSTFIYLHTIPLIAIIIPIIVHSFSDAVMGKKGTSTMMKTWFAKSFYSSNWSRALANLLKIFSFSYLSLVYMLNYPSSIGYALVSLLVAFITLRGAAQIYENIAEMESTL